MERYRAVLTLTAVHYGWELQLGDVNISLHFENQAVTLRLLLSLLLLAMLARALSGLQAQKRRLYRLFCHDTFLLPAANQWCEAQPSVSADKDGGCTDAAAQELGKCRLVRIMKGTRRSKGWRQPSKYPEPGASSSRRETKPQSGETLQESFSS